MLQKNYTNPSDRGRFGFSESGEYNAPYKGEHIIVAFLIGGIIALSVLLFIFVRSLAAANMDGTSFLMIAGAGAVGYLIFEALILLGGITLIKFVKTGFVCKYIATDDRFTLTVGGDIHIFYYKDVQSVHFQPRYLFRKVQGYDVTIKINGTLETYSITSDNYISPKTTPFYIIKERMEMERQAEYTERTLRENDMSAALDPSVSPRKKKKSYMERLNELVEPEDMPSIGAAENMPSIGVAKAPPTVDLNKEPEEQPERELPRLSPTVDSLETDPFSTSANQRTSPRVSPTIDGYEADMPSVTKEAETYIGVDGRVASIDDVISRGTFCIAYDRKITTALIIIIVMMFVIALVLFGVYIWMSAQLGLIAALIFSGWVFVLGGLVSTSVGIIIWRYFTKGIECRYKANGREFTVYRSGHADEHFLYSDVMGVTYKPRKLLWFDHGYDVQIVTRLGKAEYQYNFPRLNAPVKGGEMPFDIIRDRMELSQRRGSTSPANKSSASEPSETSQDESDKPPPAAAGYSHTASSEPETYIGEDGRAVSVEDVISWGTFWTAYSPKKTAILGITAGFMLLIPALTVIGLVLGTVFNILSFSTPWNSVFQTIWNIYDFIITPLEYLLRLLNKINPLSLLGGALGEVISLLLSAVGGIILFKYTAKGDECHYKANGRELIIRSKKHGDEHLRYSDIMGVTYLPRKLLWFDHGLDVRIVTQTGTTVIHYVFPRFNVAVEPKDTPFEILLKMKRIYDK